MKLQAVAVALIVFITSDAALAGDQRTEAAIGGGVGGAVGAVVGEELGGREGAIVGAAVGAAIGTAVATDDTKTGQEHSEIGAVTVEVDVSANDHPHGRHCPPGQAKKGRC